MEEDIAIMMADLSGYTALTETHGSTSAADLIDKYINIVENCLVGDCKLHERVGDEVMIVSNSADFLLTTALLIIKEVSGADNFLQVHGGLHFGKSLKRKNSYYGSTINLTSRIAAKATPGSFWCSEVFVTALSDRSLVSILTKGKHTFKNISEELEIFEVTPENKSSYSIDPVCRMLILDVNKAKKHPGLNEIFFCSDGCLDIYLKKDTTTRTLNTDFN